MTDPRISLAIAEYGAAIVARMVATGNPYDVSQAAAVQMQDIGKFFSSPQGLRLVEQLEGKE